MRYLGPDNVMVEIRLSGIWSYEPDPENPDDLEGRAYYGWQHHHLSLEDTRREFLPQEICGLSAFADEDNIPRTDMGLGTRPLLREGATDTPYRLTIRY